jgi:hypothetical protein
MSKILVIILSETRASELTYDSFKKNVIDELNADLCLCIGVKSDYDYNNPFYKLAKYKFIYNEPDDYGEAFDYAYNIITNSKSKYERLEGYNALYGILENPWETNNNIRYYNNIKDNSNIDSLSDDEIVIHENNFHDEIWKNKTYGIKKSTNKIVKQKDVTTYRKRLPWRSFLKIKDQFLGGIKDQYNEHPGSAGILIFFRWFLLQNLIEQNLLNKYERFIVTRSDFLYELPHPKIHLLNEKYIWIPDGENYGGYTDRHAILSKDNIVHYLNILNNIVEKSNIYFMEMINFKSWNLEMLIKYHLRQNNVIHLVRKLPYIMYSVRNINGTTRWSNGIYSNELGYYIKYMSEYNKSLYYKNKFENYTSNISEFYNEEICKENKIIEEIEENITFSIN